MNYQKQEIKEGVVLHTIPTNKFKTNMLSVFITTPLVRENVTKDALIPAILRRGCQTMKTQEEISIHLEEMYGASFDCGIEKTGDNHIIKFYLETINDDFLPQKENILENGLNTLLDIVFNPHVEYAKFKEEYVKTEKENIKQLIEGKIDNKAKYALDKCIEEMYQGKPYGLYRFGYIEDLERLDAKNLYEYYQTLIKDAKIDIFVSGKIEVKKAKQIIEKNVKIKELDARKPKYIISGQEAKMQNGTEENVITESMEITQGKLILGLDVLKRDPDSKYIALVYNAILGGGASSKLFQNVREKASLAYTAGSSYIRQKDVIFIRCGIEIKDYEQALEIIKQQLEDMKNGVIQEEEFQNAKTTIISSIQFIPDEQDTEITYYFGQELAKTMVSFEEYSNKIREVTKEQVIQLAKEIKINTIYFLRD